MQHQNSALVHDETFYLLIYQDDFNISFSFCFTFDFVALWLSFTVIIFLNFFVFFLVCSVQNNNRIIPVFEKRAI